MAKETTLNEIGEMLTHVVKHMATKEDLQELATKEQLVALYTQVNSIDMRHVKLQSRVADLEEKVFGEART
jgi:hypothetical protein